LGIVCLIVFDDFAFAKLVLSKVKGSRFGESRNQKYSIKVRKKRKGRVTNNRTKIHLAGYLFEYSIQRKAN